jgi:hypothetical protein
LKGIKAGGVVPQKHMNKQTRTPVPESNGPAPTSTSLLSGLSNLLMGTTQKNLAVPSGTSQANHSISSQIPIMTQTSGGTHSSLQMRNGSSRRGGEHKADSRIQTISLGEMGAKNITGSQSSYSLIKLKKKQNQQIEQEYGISEQ